MSRDTLGSERRRFVSMPSPSLVLDAPSEGSYYAHNELRVSGRVVDAGRVTAKLIPLDADGNGQGARLELEEARQESVALGERRFDLRLQTAACLPGPHLLNITARARDGTGLQAQHTIAIEPYDEAIDSTAAAIGTGGMAICYEGPGAGAPDEIRPRAFIRGWCYPSGGVDRVVAFLDGRIRRDLLFPVPRPDVEQALGRPDALMSGFAMPLDAEACPPGEHSLTLLVARSGRRAVGRSLTFRHRAAAPAERAVPSHDATVDRSMERSQLLDRCEFEILRATIAERHAFVSLTESNVVTEAYGALWRSKLAQGQQLENALRALAEAEQRAAAAEYWLEEQRRSLSWRLTEPLRAAKQAAGRIRR